MGGNSPVLSPSLEIYAYWFIVQASTIMHTNAQIRTNGSDPWTG